MNFYFKFRILKFKVVHEHHRRRISPSNENFVRFNRNAKFFGCKTSSSFADHPSKILISKVEKILHWPHYDNTEK